MNLRVLEYRWDMGAYHRHSIRGISKEDYDYTNCIGHYVHYVILSEGYPYGEGLPERVLTKEDMERLIERGERYIDEAQ